MRKWLFSLAALCAPAQEQPNIVWIWADNLAWADLGIYGSRHIRTPVIDSLARGGARFTHYYVAHVVCSPSRAALLTGRQPFRVGIVDVLRPDGPSGIPADEITLAEALRERGYETQAVGKWHLGDRPEFLPLAHGFDSFFGLPYSLDMLPTLLYRDNRILEELPGSKVDNVTQRLTDEAVEFISRNRDRPFFLYFSHTLPHPPIRLPEAARRAGRAIYYDAIEHIDHEVGRLIGALDRLGLRRRTLVMFSSDNGPMLDEGDTGGLRGRIHESYEGGIRVPLVANWPGRIPEGRLVETPAIAYDVFPTLLRLAGGSLPSDRIFDGQDIWPLIAGEGVFLRKTPFVWVYLNNVTALRDGRWKLHVAHRENTLPKPELYDLERDPGESRPVNDQHPEVLARLLRHAESFQSEIPHVWSLQYPVRDPAKRPSGVRRQ